MQRAHGRRARRSSRVCPHPHPRSHGYKGTREQRPPPTATSRVPLRAARQPSSRKRTGLRADCVNLGLAVTATVCGWATLDARLPRP